MGTERQVEIIHAHIARLGRENSALYEALNELVNAIEEHVTAGYDESARVYKARSRAKAALAAALEGTETS